MDPVEVAQPLTVEAIHAAVAAAKALVTGVAGTVLAFLKAGRQKPEPQQVEASTVSGWNDLRDRVDAFSQNHSEHERLVSELHSSLLDSEREVQRRLMAEQLNRIEALQQLIRSDVEAISRGTRNNAEAVETMARRLKEISQ